MRIFLTNARSDLNIGFSPPLGLLLILSYCRKRHPEQEYFFKDFNSTKSSVRDQEELIREIRPDIAGLSALTDNLADVLELAGRIKRLCPDCRVVLGGHHVTARPENAYPDIDTVVVGEGEESFRTLLRMADQGEEWPKVFAGERHLADIDLEPAWDMVEDPTVYRMIGNPFAYHPLATLLGSRGCPNRCTFCSSIMWRRHKPFCRYRSPASLVDEMERVMGLFGIKNFFLCDDAINGSLDFVNGMADQIITRGLSIRWGSSFLGDRRHAPEKLFPKLRKSGCRAFTFGVESGSPRVLKHIRKQIALEDVGRALSLSKKHGIYTHCLFMLGNAWYGPDGRPDGEYLEDMEATKNFIHGLANQGLIYYMSVSIARPYPGSELGDLVEEFGLETGRESPASDRIERRVLSFDHPNLSDQDVQAVYQAIWEKMTFHPKVLLNQLSLLKNISEFRRLARISRLQVAKLATGRKVLGRLAARMDPDG